MHVYSSTGYGRGTLFVSPGADYPERAEWMQEFRNGDDFFRKPIQYEVKFSNGVAEVDEDIGAYMIERGLASGVPVEIASPPGNAESLRELQPPRRAPIAVGRPLVEVLREQQQASRIAGAFVPGNG